MFYIYLGFFFLCIALAYHVKSLASKIKNKKKLLVNSNSNLSIEGCNARHDIKLLTLRYNTLVIHHPRWVNILFSCDLHSL